MIFEICLHTTIIQKKSTFSPVFFYFNQKNKNKLKKYPKKKILFKHFAYDLYVYEKNPHISTPRTPKEKKPNRNQTA